MTRTRTCVERTFTTWDGATLAYRAWVPLETPPDRIDDAPATRAIVLFHRGHEHGGRWQHIVDALGMDDVAVFAWDARGHGRSAGERGAAESVSALVKDADAFARHIRDAYDIRTEDTVVVAHSVGAVIAAAWAHDFAPPLAGLVLATPAFRVKL
jgi:alpha-beta hydrolase superfamily lysophospholipase